MYMTVKETATKWNISDRRVRMLCMCGKIKGAYKEGREWKIPRDAKKPEDGRYSKKENILEERHYFFGSELPFSNGVYQGYEKKY